MIDLAAEQALTPGCADKVFLDSAGSSLFARPVLDAVVAHLRREAEIGGYAAAAERAEDLAALPVAIGRLLGCAPDLLALSDSATRSWNQFVTAISWRPGDRVLICGNEYASNAISLLQRARHDGVSVEVVPTDPAGDPDLDALAGMLDERVRLVSLVHVATNSGHVSKVREVVTLAHAVGALVLLDACQSVGQLQVDVTGLGIDALSATGRKWLRGPRGTGVLYVRREVLAGLEPLAPDLRGAVWSADDDYLLREDAARFELWENDVAGRLGLLAAVEHLLSLGPAEVETAVRSAGALLRDGLAATDGVSVHDLGADLGGIVTFTVAGRDPEAVKEQLLAAGVTVSVSHASSTRLDMAQRGLAAVVRASPHYFVGPEQIAAALEAVAAIAGSAAPPRRTSR
ncbi:MAG TPA: aminotransferase class V-fold PLP-dependent enzyme [Marmoricola sp.]|nr:aminotransferase class V-fold PLP-dependent enzyme [Marmoricola sp.]